MLFCIFSLYFIPLFLFAIRYATASSKCLLAEKIMLSSSYNLKLERFHLKQNNVELFSPPCLHVYPSCVLQCTAGAACYLEVSALQLVPAPVVTVFLDFVQ